MPSFTARPHRRVLVAVVVVLFLAAVALGWAMRAGRIENAVAPTPAQPTAPGPPGGRDAAGGTPPLPTPP